MVKTREKEQERCVEVEDEDDFELGGGTEGEEDEYGSYIDDYAVEDEDKGGKEKENEEGGEGQTLKTSLKGKVNRHANVNEGDFASGIKKREEAEEEYSDADEDYDIDFDDADMDQTPSSKSSKQNLGARARDNTSVAAANLTWIESKGSEYGDEYDVDFTPEVSAASNTKFCPEKEPVKEKKKKKKKKKKEKKEKDGLFEPSLHAQEPTPTSNKLSLPSSLGNLPSLGQATTTIDKNDTEINSKKTISSFGALPSIGGGGRRGEGGLEVPLLPTKNDAGEERRTNGSVEAEVKKIKKKKEKNSSDDEDYGDDFDISFS